MGLGTWGLSGDGYGPVDEGERARVVSRALDMGITLFDTADSYGSGLMERALGRALQKRDDVVVVTKGGTDRTTMPPRKRFDPEYLRASVERSLRRLGRDQIEVYLLHNPSEGVMMAGDAAGELEALKKAGKIGCWGVSIGDVDVGRVALRRGASVIELPYNLLHPSDLHRLGGEITVAGAGVLARSTLAYGLLGGGWTPEKTFEAGDHRESRWTKPELGRRLEQMDAVRFLLRGDVKTMASAAVRFVLANYTVSCAVLGPRSVAQLEDLVREVGIGPLYLRDADLQRIPRALDAAGIEL